jgi:hypothetical protein
MSYQQDIIIASEQMDFATECLKRIKALCAYDINKNGGSLFVEIGGPCTHLKAVILTESEKVSLQEFFEGMFKTRHKEAQAMFVKSCTIVAHKNEPF